ncbi:MULTISPECIES: GDSL-type esterase/lipase family protein [unclassified Spirosoma]|uniref:GDSL-type esterase/lipase family protein n=1 Tax=unclassified Spirosoma TaxID=2621999 RepID=UPI0009696D5A|nr:MULTISPECIES: GDSL-type esterase/lipase family protein [unclassified Spirosoma]MBN8826694.1 hypothetical protein [Spirosoma sp.]OJW75059.1 MAG: hypothetical protein BGO59_18975 [Spirosoma sp. 48-14]
MKRYVRYISRLLEPEPKHPSVIMLGDSLIRLGNWNKLVGRKDILNRGVSGDSLEGICTRAQALSASTAKIIFLEGGINDLPHREISHLLARYQNLISYWQSRHVIPVVTGLLYLSPLAARSYAWRNDWQGINRQISQLNEQLQQVCAQQDLDFLDLNRPLSLPGQLRPEYTTDGVHLTDVAYTIWAEEVTRVLKKHQV